MKVKITFPCAIQSGVSPLGIVWEKQAVRDFAEMMNRPDHPIPETGETGQEQVANMFDGPVTVVPGTARILEKREKDGWWDVEVQIEIGPGTELVTELRAGNESGLSLGE